MTSNKIAKFVEGEIAILQPPHPSAQHLRGVETTVLRVRWSDAAEDAMGGLRSGWSYETDIPAPPPWGSLENQPSAWVWCEYDLRKKHDSDKSFEVLMHELNKINEHEEV